MADVLVRIPPLPIGMAARIARKVQLRALHLEFRDAESMVPPGQFNRQRDVGYFRRDSRRRPRWVADHHSFGDQSWLSRKNVQLEDSADLYLPFRACGQKSECGTAEMTGVETHGEPRHDQ